MSQTPSVGRAVHYVSYGTPGGEYQSQCRAATITEVGQWVTVETTKPESYSRSEGRPIRVLEQWFYDDAVALSVLNPTGLFFNGAGSVPCQQDEDGHSGGTWHWPERVGDDSGPRDGASRSVMGSAIVCENVGGG